MSTNGVDKKRRRFLVNVTAGAGVVGSGFAVAPFVMSMTPSERAKAAGAPVEVDISKLKLGQLLTVEWQGKPVWILRRTAVMMDSLKGLTDVLEDPESKDAKQPAYAKGIERAIKPELLVVVGLCTHLGCSPDKKLKAGAGAGLGADWPGGFFCPCHGSKFDLSGRVYKNVPAPRNLPVPPYSFKSDSVLIIGIDQNEEVA